MAKYVYSFSEGYGKNKNILGGKGVGLAEMAHLKIPIPPGFTITTEVCMAFYENKGRYPQGLKEQVLKALQKMEKDSGMKFGDPKNPLLCSARSGARSSMPGMMETVLNIGLTSKTIAGMI
jgi:pyruvate,orthophosphate dikinase